MGRELWLEKSGNMGMMGDMDGGKRSSREGMLFYSGRMEKIGESDEGG